MTTKKDDKNWKAYKIAGNKINIPEKLSDSRKEYENTGNVIEESIFF